MRQIARLARVSVALTGLVTVLATVLAPSAAAGIAADEYAARREKLAAAIGPDALVVLVSPEPAPRNGDVEWPFRQDDNLYYLTGIRQADTALVLLPGESDHREVLFVADRDPLAEAWTGPLLDRDQAKAISGVGEVVSIHRFDGFLAAALGGGSWGESDLYRYYRPPGMPAFLAAMRAGRATLWLDLTDRGGRGGQSEPPSPPLRLAERLRGRWPELAVRDLSPLVVAQRMVKSPAELELIRRAVDVTVEAQEAGMRRTLSAEFEYQVLAAVEFVFRDRGACCWGFPSIVASGEHTTILHYPDADAPIDRGGLMLLDIGADVEGYTADVTRTFPADGTFSPEQREIYEVVLTAWNECLPRLRAGAVFADVHRLAEEAIARELAKLGLVAAAEPEQARMYFIHGLGHPMGLAVHDVADRTQPLEAGTVWTLEPGVYVRRGDVEASETFKGLSEDDRAKVRAALERYDGIGARIEDDVLVTDGAPRVLSEGAPRTVQAIEGLLAGAGR